MLNLFEKLINEHGSSTILKERITAIKEQYTTLETERDTLKSEVRSLTTLLKDKELIIDDITTELQKFEDTFTSKYFCDHCPSNNLKRVGNRKDPSFKLSTVMQAVFECQDCGKQTYIDLDD